MPKYFFDLEDGTRARDTRGAEFPNDQAAKQEAMLRALDGHGSQMEQYVGFLTIIVRNEDGQEIFRKRIGQR